MRHHLLGRSRRLPHGADTRVGAGGDLRHESQVGVAAMALEVVVGVEAG